MAGLVKSLKAADKLNGNSKKRGNFLAVMNDSILIS